MKTLLRNVYDELKYLGKVKNQTDFADKLGYNKSFMSVMLARNTLVDAMPAKLSRVFGISRDWLDNYGPESDVKQMFARLNNKVESTKDYGQEKSYSHVNVNDIDLQDTKLLPTMLKDMIALYRESTEVSLTLARANEHLARSREKDSDSMNIMAKGLDRLINGNDEGRQNFAQAV